MSLRDTRTGVTYALGVFAEIEKICRVEMQTDVPQEDIAAVQNSMIQNVRRYYNSLAVGGPAISLINSAFTKQELIRALIIECKTSQLLFQILESHRAATSKTRKRRASDAVPQHADTKKTTARMAALVAATK